MTRERVRTRTHLHVDQIYVSKGWFDFQIPNATSMWHLSRQAHGIACPHPPPCRHEGNPKLWMHAHSPSTEVHLSKCEVASSPPPPSCRHEGNPKLWMHAPPNRGSPSKVRGRSPPPTHTHFQSAGQRGISLRWIVKRTKNNPPWSYKLSLVVGQSDGCPCDPRDGLARQ